MASQLVENTLKAATERLETARFGLADMKIPERVQSGLYNSVVFGRMVTFSLQNLRGKVAGFDTWYDEKQEQMRAQPLLKFFHDLRTKIEKQSDRHTSSSTSIKSFSSNDMVRLSEQKPPGATAFFIGDQLGRSGWEVPAADGSVQRFFIDLPPHMGVSTMLHLNDAPESYREKSAPDLIAIYLDAMEALIKEAKQKFT